MEFYMLVSDFLQRDKNNLDLLRIVCAAAVIFGHSYYLSDAGGSQDPLKELVGFTYSGSTAVKVFFFISGLLVTNSLVATRSVLHFLVSRTFRIYPALVVVILVSALLIGPTLTIIPFNEYIHSEITKTYIFSNLMMETQYVLPGVFNNNFYKDAVNGSLWTIPYEVASYMVLLGVFLISASGSRHIWGVICLIIIASPVMGINKYLFINSDNPDIYMLAPCFALGVIYALYKDIIHVSYHAPLGFALLFYLVNDETLSHMLFFFMVCTMFLYLSSLSFVRRIKIKNDISYGVYLYGFLSQQIINNFLPNIHIHINQIFSLLLSMAFGYLSFVIIERPFMRLGRHILK
ncbi:acyltransferase [Salmonella enterica subsp. enterica serovar Veneziana]|nr:acyltransferase [Salmonella enterica subsp. enterica serovar Veneziana]EBV3061935.1 acyltransferase [Salmonella enterica subsp. enterica serovar Veneziana]ECJ8651432.1 acyltransferase [Salmonella enterica subsp. enterica serovar Veneziana]